MESKKINQLATNVNPQTSDLTTIGDPITGQLKKITWLQVAHLIGAQAAVTLQQVTDNGNTTTDPITTGGLTLTNLNTGVPRLTSGEFVGTYGYGLANGVATLDSGGKIPAAQLPSSVMEYKGTWNASTNTPTLADGTGDNGDVYLVNVAGSQNLGSGTISFAVGDWVVYNGTIWQKSLNSNAVASVFGRTGTITAQEGDYTIDQLGDVAITSAATNDYLRYNGSGWVNTAFPTFVSSDKLVLQVRNNSGATINKGTVVYINGATAGYPTIAKAIASGDATSAQTLGLVQDNISNNSNGVVVLVGQITGLDTSAYAAGTQLYLSGTTAGAYTSTKTLAPTHLVYVGIVSTSNAVNGAIEVKIQNGYELEEIHDVAISSVANNEGLFYESSTSLWKNKSISTVLGYTPEQPLTFSAPLSRSTNTVSIPAATGSVNGYLTSTDWTTFNNKITNPMTTLGDIIFGGTSGNPNRLAGNTTTTKQYLSQTGTGTDSASPTWATITGSDITGAALTKTDDTNVTLTLGGTPATALLRAASLTLGWTGQLSVARGGTGLSALGTAGQLLRVNIGATALEYFTPTYISAAITSLNGLTAATQTFANDINVTITSATATHTIGWSGELSIARGGTGASTKSAAFNALSPMTTLGDIIYGGASGTGTRLAGSTSASKRFLTQTGDGTNSAAPAWGALASADIPNNAADTTGNAATATKLATARDFTINGTAKSFDGSANISWTAAEIGLTSYLPLAGGTLSGQLILKEGTDSTDYTKGLRFPNDPYGGSGDISGIRLYRDGAGTEKMVLELYIGNDSTGASQDRINFATGIGGTADNNLVTINGNKIWNEGNDGTGSGLDADLLDGQHGSYYATASSLSGYLPLTGGTLTGTLMINATDSSAGLAIKNTTPDPDKVWDISPSGNNLQFNESDVAPVLILKAGGGNNVRLYSYSTNGFLKTSGSDGTLSVDTTSYQPLLTNPITGTGTANKLVRFTGSTSVGNSIINDDGDNLWVTKENTYFGVDAQNATRMGFMKKAGFNPYLAYAVESFVIASTDGTSIAASNTFTPRLTMTVAGDATFAASVSASTLSATTVTGTNNAGVVGLYSVSNNANGAGIYIDNSTRASGKKFGLLSGNVENAAFSIKDETSNVTRFIINSGGEGYFKNVFFVDNTGNSQPALRMRTVTDNYVTEWAIGQIPSATTFGLRYKSATAWSGTIFGVDTTGAATFSSSVDTGSYIRNTNSSADSAVTIAADGTAHYISVTNAARSAYRNLLLNPYGGNVGINTNSPATTLDVGGIVRSFVSGNSTRFVSTDGTVEVRLGTYTTPLGYVGTESNHPFAIYTNGSEKMRIFSGGNVRIGGTLTDAGYKFHVEGSNYFDGNVGINGEGKGLSIDTGYGTNGRVGLMKYGGYEGMFVAGVSTVLRLGHRTDSEYIATAGSPSIRVDLTLAANGDATFVSKVTATSFFESSDMRLKSNIQDYKSNDILNISAKIYEKDGKVEVGYLAQDLESVLGNAVSIRDNGYLDLSYRQVHTAKIAALEAKIKELESKMN